MRGERIRLAAISLAASLAIGAAGAAASLMAQNPGVGHGGHASMDKASMKRLHEALGKSFDYVFLSEMVEHHAGGVQMSQATLKHAKTAEVKEAARKVIREQTKESGQMIRWAKAWAGKAPDPKLRQLVRTEMRPMMQAFQKDCRQDCDHAFLKHMKMHHQEGIHMAEMAREKAAHAELRQLAEKMVRSQTAEVEKFDRLMTKHY